MLRQKLKYYGYRVAPRPAAALHGRLRRWTHGLRFRRRHAGAADGLPESDVLDQARALRDRSRDVREIDRLAELVFQYSGIAPNQHPGEIVELLARVRELRPRRLCEIGSAGGGTLFLFSSVAHPQARILSIDLNNDSARAERFQLLVEPGQRLTCVQGDSRSAQTRERFRSWIGETGLDFLFIDGDHSYEGVKHDYRTYGAHVRPGGIVAFHDIVPDFKSRYGVDTGTHAGGVPEFWAQLKRERLRLDEFVDHRLQDGLGIGVLELPEDSGRSR
jgi:predicted O-methyltransferase YrrM